VHLVPLIVDLGFLYPTLSQQAFTGKKIHIQESVEISCCIQDQLLLMV